MQVCDAKFGIMHGGNRFDDELLFGARRRVGGMTSLRGVSVPSSAASVRGRRPATRACREPRASPPSPTSRVATGRPWTLDPGYLVLSKIGRIAVRWSRPIEGTPKTVTIRREADGWYACFSCEDFPAQPLPPTGQETGVDLGIEAFATL